MPIANKMLEFAKGKSPENKVFTFDEVFYSNPPNNSLIMYINEKFGGDFDFQSIEWEFSIHRMLRIFY